MENVRTELLTNVKARFVLGAYGAPASPSEVARNLGIPANTVHYWTKRLEKAELLEQVGVTGRVRTYQSLVPDDECRLEACAPFVQGVMDALNKVVLEAARRYDLVGTEAGASLPQVGVHEVSLTPGDADRLVNALKDLMPKQGNRNVDEAKPYTVAFIVAPGKFSDNL